MSDVSRGPRRFIFTESARRPYFFSCSTLRCWTESFALEMEFSKMPRFGEEKDEEVPGPGYYHVQGSSSQMKLKAALQRSLVTQEALRSRLVLIQNARKKEKASAIAATKAADTLAKSLRASSNSLTKDPGTSSATTKMKKTKTRRRKRMRSIFRSSRTQWRR